MRHLDLKAGHQVDRSKREEINVKLLRTTVTNTSQKPYCFVSYSTRERHVQLLIDSLNIVLNGHFEVRLTPSVLVSGASQRDRITELIKDCTFAVVILDGLRPNVVFEYGVIHGYEKPAILFKEVNAQVDVSSYYGDTVGSEGDLNIDLNTQFSNIKDVYFAEWNRFDLENTVNLVWEEYNKKKDEIQGFIEIEEPKLW